MRLADCFVLRRYITQPWTFRRLRKHPPSEPFYDVTFKDGGSFRLRSQRNDHWHVFLSIFVGDEYRLNGIAQGSLATVIDIGGHIGVFAVRVAPLARRVLSYEPMPESYDLLVRNVSRFPHVKACRAAVAGRRGTSTLLLGRTSLQNTIFPPFGENPGGSSITVECVTLADIFAEHAIDRCDLLKIDCEGAEYEILYSVPNELWPRIEKICMEYHPAKREDDNWTGEGLVRYLASVGHKAQIYPSRKDPQQGHIFSVRRNSGSR